ncbi:MAG: exodeoxyribonuclease V subunit gamma, partial [Burkholderiaceae bacterium]|nr:exodeoxyribonuclease V subunit gamma [Burkholderiaceae bacterium]
RRDGVCARVSIEFPGRFLWRLLERAVPGLPGRSPFDPAIARWAILGLLAELPAEPDFELLRARVAAAAPQGRLELAADIARVFDRYLAYRRDWLERWARGGWLGAADGVLAHEPWQRWLWSRLLERLPGVSREHPFQSFRRLLDEAGRSGPDGAARLRVLTGIERVRLFGLVPMAPEQFQLYGALGEVLDVRWFAPDPCRDFWLDVVSAAQAARIAAAAPESAWLYEDEPAILGDWGRAHRDFLVQLRQLEESYQVNVDEEFRERSEPRARSDLEALQRSVLMRSDAPWDELTRRDHREARDGEEPAAIEIHAAHGPTRQVEVLHDRLLALFDEMPQLRPEEVVVFCTNVEIYAARIQAVFGAAPAQLRIPFRISGEMRTTDQVVVAALEVLALAAQPIGVEAVAALLGNSALAQALGLDSAQADELRSALVAAGIHGEFTLDPATGSGGSGGGGEDSAEERHGWTVGIERLLLGAAVSDDIGLLPGRVPVCMFSVRGSEGLGRLMVLLDDIGCFRGAPRMASVESWCALTHGWLEKRFGPLPELRDGWLVLRDALIELGDSALAGAAPPVDLMSFRQALADALAATAGSAEPGGMVTVAPLGSIRGVPYRVVCLLGMDDEAWPRRAAASEYDLMVVRPRFGDRIARLDDRGIFLDAVLGARERLVILYRGREARDNSRLQPATVVRELIGYVDRHRGAPLEVREHPLQPFAPRVFGGGTGPARSGSPGAGTKPERDLSFAFQWLDAARVLAQPLALRSPAEPLAARKLVPATAEPDAVELAALVDVFARPARLFLRDGVGVSLPYESVRTNDDPPVDIEPTRREFNLALRALRGGEGPARIAARLAQKPDYPAASLGLARALAVVREAERLAAALDQLEAGLDGGARQSERLALRVEIDGLTIVGEVGILGVGTLQLLETAYGFGVWAAAEAWLRHLLWQCAIEQGRLPAGGQAQTMLAAGDDLRRVVPPDNATAELRTVLAAWRRVRCEPLALFPRTTWAYLEKGGDAAQLERATAHPSDGGDPAAAGAHRRALGAAHSTLMGAPGGGARAESDDPWLEAMWRGAPPPLESILGAGLPLYEPLFARLELSPGGEEKKRSGR